jgi:hypothetical protein
VDVLLNYFRTLPRRQVVRPWALAVPILVLLVALPLLRPLRSPEPYNISSNELSRLAAIQAMGEEHRQEIDNSAYYAALRNRDFRHPPETVRLGKHAYSDTSPVLQLILAGVYIILMKFHLTLANNAALVTYLLTIVGAVVPVAASAGMIYRMGRLFELKRPWRTALALAVTFGSGLISYAVVLNAHAPAAALVLGACACLVHTSVAKVPTRTGAWLMTSGFCAALAAVIEPAAFFFLVGLVFVIIALRWRKRLRLGGILLYGIGAVGPLMLHAVLTIPITGDVLPPSLHAEMQPHDTRVADAAIEASDDEAPLSTGWVHATLLATARVVGALLGSHGVFSHFPVLLVGLAGISLVLRRHWPIATKVMAAVTLAGGAVIVLTYALSPSDGPSAAAMFGPRWSIVFLPLLLFWAGAWLRRQHRPITWVAAGCLLVFSMSVSLIGTTAPFLVAPGRYTAVTALRQLLHPPAPPPERPVLASN